MAEYVIADFEILDVEGMKGYGERVGPPLNSMGEPIWCAAREAKASKENGSPTDW